VGEPDLVYLAQNNEILERAQNYARSPIYRNQARTMLLSTAKKHDDENLWDKLGTNLVEAFRNNDLNVQLSVLFVSKCPDNIFRKFVDDVHGEKYIAWVMRAKGLALQPAPKLKPKPPFQLT
jgi:hypothetical protein